MIRVLVFSSCLFISALAQGSLEREAEFRLGTANNRYTGIFLYNGLRKYPGSNFITSLFPALEAFGVMAKFSIGKTRETAYQILELENEDQIDVIFPYVRNNYFSESLLSSPKYTLKVYTDNNNKFCPAFKKSFAKYFYGRTGVVDYTYPYAAAKSINNYVKRQGSAFRNLVVGRKIEDKNGLNFISTYQLQYKFKDFVFIKDQDISFKSDKGVVNVNGAVGVGVVKVAKVKSIGATTIEIIGIGGEFSYYIVIPDKPGRLLDVLDQFRDPELFQQVLKKGKKVCAKVRIPSRKILTTIDLGNSFKDLPKYYNELFVPGALDLNGVSQNCSKTYIASILQEIYLIPDSTNGSRKDSPCSSYDIELTADQPFIFYLMCATSSIVRSPLVAIAVQS